MTFHIVVPQWVNLTIGIPVLLIIALVINYLSAIWLHPVLRKDGRKSGTTRIFCVLTFFSVLSAAFGSLSAWWGTSTLVALLLMLLFAAFGAFLMRLPTTLCVVASTVSIPTFFIGQVAIQENTLIAFLLTIAGTASVLLLGVFAVMLIMIDKKQNS